jgi:hypothetical protein
MTTDSPHAIMIGGPRDGDRFATPEAALIQLQIDGLFHRYIRTTATREIDGEQLLVYNYDGEVR